METHKTNWNRAIRASLIVYVFVLGYAIVRYNVVRDVSLELIPLFINNKAIALTSVIIIGWSFILGPCARLWPSFFEKRLGLRKPLGLIGFGLAATHALMSLILLSPSYYAKFFLEGGKLNLMGESSMLFGVLSFVVFSVVSVSSFPSVEAKLDTLVWKRVQRLGYLAFFFTLLHVVIMGFSGWLKAESFKYGLASISLLSALVIIIVLLTRIFVPLLRKR